MPDGQSVLYTIVPAKPTQEAEIALLDLKTGTARILMQGGTSAHYVPVGWLVYGSGSTIKAVRFDAGRGEIRGDPVSLPDVAVATAADNAAAQFTVSATGTLAFIPPDESGITPRVVSWVDRQGREDRLPIPPGQYRYPRVSPDATRVALDVSGANRDIWIWNIQRQTLTKLTDGPTEDNLPLWSRDGSRVFFGSNRSGDFDIYSQAADGATPARVEFAGPGAQMPSSLTPDGTEMIVNEDFKNMSLLHLGHAARLEPLLHGELNHWLGIVSPDGKWMAYESNESGSQLEVFIRPFPDVNGRREKVSINGGRYPLWGSKRSGELYYVDPGGAMMAASVALSPALRLGRVTKLFDAEKPLPGISGRPYDVSPIDGRFLLTRPAAQAPNIDISIVLNWPELLRELPAEP